MRATGCEPICPKCGDVKQYRIDPMTGCSVDYVCQRCDIKPSTFKRQMLGVMRHNSWRDRVKANTEKLYLYLAESKRKMSYFQIEKMFGEKIQDFDLLDVRFKISVYNSAAFKYENLISAKVEE